MFSTKFSFFLLLVLFVPLFLRLQTVKLEPYPAVLLPSGPKLLELNSGFLNINNTQLYGLDKEGNWKKIDHVKLLHPIPLQYLSPILSTKFGLENPLGTNSSPLIRFLNTSLFNSKRKEINNNGKKELAQWINRKLHDQGLSPDSIKIIKGMAVISTYNNQVISKQGYNEEIISFIK